MNKLISIIAGIITLLGGFHIYLNLVNEEDYSFEDTLKIYKTSFNENPIKTLIFTFLILSTSVLLSFLTRKLQKQKNNIDSHKKSVNHFIENQNKSIKLREDIYEKLVNPKIDYIKSIKEPWTRINGKYHSIILRDFYDQSFPELGNWYKAEVFDLHKNGIEFFEIASAIGFEIYYDKNGCWDVFFHDEKRKKGNYTKIDSEAFCTYSIPHEEILSIDWEHDDYHGCATFFCEFKKVKGNRKLPYDQVCYYYRSEYGHLEKLDDRKKRNFKTYRWTILNRFIKRPLRKIKARKLKRETKSKIIKHYR